MFLMGKKYFRNNKVICQFCQQYSLGIEVYKKYLSINENNFKYLITDIKMQRRTF